MTEAMPKNGPNPGHTARRPVHSFEAAIFDLDGVLVDTAKYHFSAWRQIATEYGFELTEDIAESIKGVGRRAALDLVLRSGRITLPEAEARQIANKKNDYYNNYIRSIDSSDLLPGALNALNKLRRNGVRIACHGTHVARQHPATRHHRHRGCRRIRRRRRTFAFANA